MTTSENIAEIAAALAKAQAEMGNAHLNKTNPHFKSRYADLAAIRDAVVPALAKNDIAIIQPTDIIEGQLVVVTTLVHKSGQFISGIFPVSASANATAQQIGSAVTYARRYSIAAMVGIAAEEDDDGNAAETIPRQPAKVQAVKTAEKSDPFKAFFAKPSYAFNKPTAGEWVKAWWTAVEHCPTIEALTKLEADNKAHIDALDDSLAREVQRSLEQRMAFYAQQPVAAE